MYVLFWCVKFHYSWTHCDSYLPLKYSPSSRILYFCPLLTGLQSAFLTSWQLQVFYITSILTKPYHPLTMTHTFSFLHLSSQNPCLPGLHHLHLFTYSINTIEHLLGQGLVALRALSFPWLAWTPACWSPLSPTRLAHRPPPLWPPPGSAGQGWLPDPCTLYLTHSICPCQLLAIHP